MGIKIGLDTGFSKDIASLIFNRLQWAGRIDYMVASDEVKNGRPFPDMIQKIMSELGIEDTNEVVKVGDTEVDVNEGINAGCKYVIGITTGSFKREQLEPYHPTHIIDDISEVIAIINQ
jgi:phosphonatase-like hydrolase